MIHIFIIGGLTLAVGAIATSVLAFPNKIAVPPPSCNLIAASQVTQQCSFDAIVANPPYRFRPSNAREYECQDEALFVLIENAYQYAVLQYSQEQTNNLNKLFHDSLCEIVSTYYKRKGLIAQENVKRDFSLGISRELDVLVAPPHDPESILSIEEIKTKLKAHPVGRHSNRMMREVNHITSLAGTVHQDFPDAFVGSIFFWPEEARSDNKRKRHPSSFEYWQRKFADITYNNEGFRHPLKINGACIIVYRQDPFQIVGCFEPNSSVPISFSRYLDRTLYNLVETYPTTYKWLDEAEIV